MKSLLTKYAAILFALTFATRLEAQDAVPARIEFHGLVQNWFVANDTTNTFRVRRAEIAAVGRLSDVLRWKVQVDPSKLPDQSSFLQDAQLSYVLDRVTIDIGQFKVPIGREGLMSSAVLETAERTLQASTSGKFGDVRDVGVQARAALPNATQLAMGVFNGLGERLNRQDASSQKAVVARFVTSIPFLGGLSVGATGAAVVGPSDRGEGKRDRLGFDASFTTERVTLRSEYMRGEDVGVERTGYYALAAYRFAPAWQAAVRYDVWDPVETDIAGGITYTLDKSPAVLQLNYTRKSFELPAIVRHVVIAHAQIAW